MTKSHNVEMRINYVLISGLADIRRHDPTAVAR
jgi:hypothetical protein